MQVAISIAKHLAQSGHSVTVYYFKGRIEFKLPEEITFSKINFFSRLPWNEYDIIHSHGFVPDTYVHTSKPKYGRAKTVSTIHNYVFTELKLLYNGFVAQLLGSVWITAWSGLDQLVVLSNDAVKYYSSRLPKKRIDRIYNGKNIARDPNLILPEHKRLAEEIRTKYKYCIGTNAALITRKRLDILIRHLSRVDQGGLLIVGEGSERKNLEALVVKFGLEDRVKFLGYVSTAQVYNELYDLCAFPSVSEGFSLSLIEAAFYQKKIVCSDIPSFREAFTNDEITFFDSEDELTIDRAIEVAITDESKPIKAFEKAKASYTEEKMGEAYEELFNRLQQRGSPNP